MCVRVCNYIYVCTYSCIQIGEAFVYIYMYILSQNCNIRIRVGLADSLSVCRVPYHVLGPSPDSLSVSWDPPQQTPKRCFRTASSVMIDPQTTLYDYITTSHSTRANSDQITRSIVHQVTTSHMERGASDQITRSIDHQVTRSLHLSIIRSLRHTLKGGLVTSSLDHQSTGSLGHYITTSHINITTSHINITTSHINQSTLCDYITTSHITRANSDQIARSLNRSLEHQVTTSLHHSDDRGAVFDDPLEH